MKKFFKVGVAMLLAAAMILSTAACGKGGNEGGSGNYDDEIDLAVTPYKYTPDTVQALTEGHMTERPSYALAEGAGVEEQRKMAIQAMWDELTFKWTTTKGFTYQKSGAAEGHSIEKLRQSIATQRHSIATIGRGNAGFCSEAQRLGTVWFRAGTVWLGIP